MEELKALQKLTDCLAKLPSIGHKTAERLAYGMLDMDDEELNVFADAIKNLKPSIHRCPTCGMLCEKEKCSICLDDDRDEETLMVVSYPKDVIAFEKSRSFNGRYHVLNGVISIRNGTSFEDLNTETLFSRLDEGKIKEVIIATNPNVDGETTAIYLAKKMEKYHHIKVTRLAYGMQMGGALDYTDSLTLGKAIEGRQRIGD